MRSLLKQSNVKILYPVQANILYLKLEENTLSELLLHYKLGVSSRLKNTVRVVIPCGVKKSDVNKFINILKSIQSASLS